MDKTMMYNYEQQGIADGFECICGVDEAGRGPLAGPVYAAAVILPLGLVIDGLDDSKKLTEKKREFLFDVICEKAVSYCIASASPKEIDELNILNATMLAMRRAVEGLSVTPDLALVDGNCARNFPVTARCIVKGDQNSASIAAASVLAKVSRDRYMCELDKTYPQYEFMRHKGYPTKLHYEKIAEYGISDIHRRSFLKKMK